MLWTLHWYTSVSHLVCPSVLGRRSTRIRLFHGFYDRNGMQQGQYDFTAPPYTLSCDASDYQYYADAAGSRIVCLLWWRLTTPCRTCKPMLPRQNRGRLCQQISGCIEPPLSIWTVETIGLRFVHVDSMSYTESLSADATAVGR